MSDTLPTDQFSKRLRELTSNPATVRSSSTIQLEDPYGNLDSWIVDTFRADGKEEVLLQRIAASGGATRIVLPPQVMAAIGRHRGRATKVIRRRGARQAAQTRKERGAGK